MAANVFSFSGFMLRWVTAIVLVVLTYNPLGYSFSQWVYREMQTGKYDSVSLLVLAGIVLFIGWLIFIRATLRSLGFVGVTLVASLLAAIVWVGSDWGWLSFNAPSVFAWVVIIAVSVILGLGMSWSHVRRAMAGQVDMDDVDES